MGRNADKSAPEVAKTSISLRYPSRRAQTYREKWRSRHRLIAFSAIGTPPTQTYRGFCHLLQVPAGAGCERKRADSKAEMYLPP